MTPIALHSLWPKLGPRRVPKSNALQLASCPQDGTATSFHDHIVVKETGNSVVTLWHHDPLYYLMGGPKNISFWKPPDQ